MNNSEILVSKNKFKILEMLFYEYPVSVSTFFKGINPAFAKKFLKYLEENKIATIKREHNLRLWSPNFHTQETICLYLLLETERIKKIVKNKSISSYLNQLMETAATETIILFGSYAKGEARPDSDIDILVLFETPARERIQQINSIFSTAKAEVRFMSFKDLKKEKDNPMINSILTRPKERVLLANSEQFIRWTRDHSQAGKS